MCLGLVVGERDYILPTGLEYCAAMGTAYVYNRTELLIGRELLMHSKTLWIPLEACRQTKDFGISSVLPTNRGREEASIKKNNDTPPRISSTRN